jgi:hypothetical protein
MEPASTNFWTFMDQWFNGLFHLRECDAGAAEQRKWDREVNRVGKAP